MIIRIGGNRLSIDLSIGLKIDKEGHEKNLLLCAMVLPEVGLFNRYPG
jgi:hypothetical protein